MYPLVTAEFSNDGLNDLILVTPSGFYGFVQTWHPGALFFGMLVPRLIVAMRVICQPPSELDDCKTSSAQVRPIEGRDL